MFWTILYCYPTRNVWRPICCVPGPVSRSLTALHHPTISWDITKSCGFFGTETNRLAYRLTFNLSSKVGNRNLNKKKKMLIVFSWYWEIYTLELIEWSNNHNLSHGPLIVYAFILWYWQLIIFSDVTIRFNIDKKTQNHHYLLVSLYNRDIDEHKWVNELKCS